MNAHIVLLGCLALVTFVCWSTVSAETCTTNTNCNATICTGNSEVICQHPVGSDGIKPGGGLCTCKDTTGSCTTKEDCYGTGANLQCPDNTRHCYDNNCICDRFPIG
ncbi:serine protease inhibitor Cvsi-2-like [Dreissena polymorpha]|uniref:Uncharacterized protein n=1 Tax=Dreissena polymorpha TaxID=45954 RepID=A0A9D4NNZ8_DREPO|nr:serine protease inhibitor Cvsi-2-like [Dreissena polymorpha]KAH3897132.1 hypothetical protein DPMN_021317 [Dreissena polymorpha]